MPERAHVQRTYLRHLADWARREDVAPAAAVAGLAGVAARAEGWPSTGLDAVERLSPGGSTTAPPAPPAELDLGPSLLGSAYEAVLDAGQPRDGRRGRDRLAAGPVRQVAQVGPLDVGSIRQGSGSGSPPGRDRPVASHA